MKPNVKLAVCTYHNSEDEDLILGILKEKNFSCEQSEGYMLFLYSKLDYPYFRRGIVRAQKIDKYTT